MTYIKTYNELIEEFKLFSDDHFQLKDFGNGPTSDIGVSRKMEFPYMWITHRTPSSITVGNRIQIPDIVLTFIVVDQINNQDNYLDINGVDSDNQQEILSDTLEIVQDLINYISQNLGSRGVSLLQNTVSLEPTYDDTDDRVTGWVIDLTLRLKHLNCITPMADVVYPSGTTPTYITPSPYLTCDTLENCSIIQQLLNSSGSTGVLKYVQTESLVIDPIDQGGYSLISGQVFPSPNIDYSGDIGIGDLTFPANTLKKGDVYHLHMGWFLTTDNLRITGPYFEIYLGGYALYLDFGNTIYNYGGLNTLDMYDLDMYFTIREEGAAGTAEIYVFGKVLGQPFNFVDNTNFSTTTTQWIDIVLQFVDIDVLNYPTLTNYGITLNKLNGGEGLTCDTLSGCTTIQTIESDIDNLYLTKNSRLYTQTSDSTTITNTTTESSLIGTGLGSLSIPPNGFQIGDTFRVVMGGRLTNSNNEDLTIRVKSGSVILANSNLQTLTTHSDDTFKIEIDFTIRNIGGTGVANIMTLGSFQTIKKNSSQILGFEFTDENNTTFDTTIPNSLDITLEWDNAIVGNSIYSQIFTLQKTY